MAHALTNEELLEQFDLAQDGDTLKEENGAEIALKKYDNVLRAIDDYIYGI